MSDVPVNTVLIIGASQGLGLQWVKYYKGRNYIVIATTKNIEAAIKLRGLLTGSDDKILELDVTNTDSVILAMSHIQNSPDIIIYNAGVKGYTKHPDIKATLLNAQLVNSDISSRDVGRELAFQVNAQGFDRVLSVLKDKILMKHKIVVAYISTGVADTSQNTDGGYPHYRQSKAAGDAYARGWDVDLCHDTVLDLRPRIFSIIPGLVNTGMGVGIEGAADPIKRVADMAEIIEHVKITGDTHGIWKYDGTKHVQYELPVMIRR